MAPAPDALVTTPRGRRWLVWIIVATILGRGAYGLYDYRAHGMEAVAFYSDTAGYIDSTANLVRTGRYEGADGKPDIRRPPGLVPLLWPGIVLDQIIPVTFALQVLLGGLTVFLTWSLALRLTERESVALIAACLVALDPGGAIYTSAILSEMLFLTVMVVSYLLLFQSLRSGRTGLLMITGLLIGYATLVRPISVGLPLALAPFLLLGLLQRGQRAAPAAARVLLFTLLALAPPGAWIYRNIQVADFHGLTTVAGFNQYFYNAAGLEAYHTGTTVQAVAREWGSQDPQRYLARHPEQAEWTPAQRAEWQWAEGSRRLRAEWPLALWLQVKGIAPMLLARYQLGTVGYFTLLGNLLFTPLALLGWFVPIWRARRSELRVLLVCFLYLAVMSGGPAGYSRFRVPLVPLIAISAAGGLVHLVRLVRHRASPATSPAEGEPA